MGRADVGHQNSSGMRSWAHQDSARPGIAGIERMLLVDTLDEPIRFIQGKPIGIERGSA